MLVLGPSGSGKSTLTLCLDGLIPHLVEGDYSGEVVVAGLVVKDTPVGVLARQTGLVFQDPDSQFCTLTVDDEIAFGLENLQTPPGEIEAAIDRALDVVRLPDLRGRHLGSLSGGEKQRVALAAVLAMGPRLLVLDEPTANLDPAATTRALPDPASTRRGTGSTPSSSSSTSWTKSSNGSTASWCSTATAACSTAATLGALSTTTPSSCGGRACGGRRPSSSSPALEQAGWQVPGRPLAVGETVAALRATPGLVDRLRGRRLRRSGPRRAARRRRRDAARGGRRAAPHRERPQFHLSRRSRCSRRRLARPSTARTSSRSSAPTARARPRWVRCCPACSNRRAGSVFLEGTDAVDSPGLGDSREGRSRVPEPGTPVRLGHRPRGARLQSLSRADAAVPGI